MIWRRGARSVCLLATRGRNDAYETTCVAVFRALDLFLGGVTGQKITTTHAESCS